MICLHVYGLYENNRKNEQMGECKKETDISFRRANIKLQFWFTEYLSVISRHG